MERGGAGDPLDTMPSPGDRRWSEALDALRGGAAPGAEEVFPLLLQSGSPEALDGFARAVYLADLACYPAAGDQVDWPRLLRVMRAFPRGFRVWGGEAPGLGWVPVGYTGWYPIAEATFAALEGAEAWLGERDVPALSEVGEEGCFVYVFNFSIVPALRGSSASRRLLGGLSEDVAGVLVRGMGAITVSPEGARVVERFGMRRCGTLRVGGCEEGVFVRRGG